MAITISPNANVATIPGLPVCFQASAIVTLPQEDERCIDLPASGTNWVFDQYACEWTKVSGGMTTDAPAYGPTPVNGLQPFHIQAFNLSFTTPSSPYRNFASYVGVIASGGGFYGWLVWKSCGGQSTSTCNFNTTSNQAQNWKAFIIADDVIVNPIPSGVNGSEGFRLRSDGSSFYWDWYTLGSWRNGQYGIPLPSDERFTFHLNSSFPGNKWHAITTFKHSFLGSVPTIWTVPDGGTLTGTGGSRCYTSDDVGNYSVCVSSDYDTPVCINVEVAPLYFRPADFNCGNCVFTGEIVKFESNGGTVGSLSATGGTVLGPLSWQAPVTPTDITLTYTLDSSIDCELHVIEKPKILNLSDDTITGLIAGESFQIETNYPYPNIVWYNVDCPNVVSSDGVVTIPSLVDDDCFGALDCTIEGRLESVPGMDCSNLIDGDTQLTMRLRVTADPVFPTPEFGGPTPIKWKPETPDFRVITNEYEGGCDETYIRNRVPIYRWTVNYTGVAYGEDPPPCTPRPCCGEEHGFINGISPDINVAKRLDDFWLLVGGTSGYFTLKDFRTGQIWRRVRFEGAMERDHINWRTIQSRNITLVWKPCCVTEPAGATCSHNTTIVDTYAPTVPANLAADGYTPYSIEVSWDASIDNIGVKGYHLLIDGHIVDVGNTLRYFHSPVLPNVSHTYQVRAYDAVGNTSAWSAEVIGTPIFIDLIHPTTPTGFYADTSVSGEIILHWDASTDNVGVTGYDLIADGYVINVGNVLTRTFTGIANCSSHEYYVRSYDAQGNKSVWSFPLIVVTAGCGDVIDGSNSVIEGSDPVVE